MEKVHLGALKSLSSESKRGMRLPQPHYRCVANLSYSLCVVNSCKEKSPKDESYLQSFSQLFTIARVQAIWEESSLEASCHTSLNNDPPNLNDQSRYNMAKITPEVHTNHAGCK